MTNLGSLPNPPNPWTRAPKTISGWGYSALILLSVAATGVSLFNGNMAALIITLVVMFGFFISLWALDRITRATRGFWQNFGRILSVVVVGAIALLFVEILVYIGTSYPAWLDVWFRPGYKVDPPSNPKLRPGAQAPSFRYAGRGLLVPRLVQFQTPLMHHVRHPRGSACQMGTERPPGTTPDRTTSITVSWSPSVQQGTSVEISVRGKGEAGEFPEPVVTTPGEHGTARVTDLKPATVYEVKIVNVLRSRRSAPVIGAIATDADLTTLGRLLSGTKDVWDSGFGQWSAHYTGALNAEGRPEADFASMVFESWDDTAKRNVACWMYQGAFRGGLPHGSGKLSAMPEYCEGPECGSTCNGTFKDGKIETASCALFLGGIAYPTAGARQTLYGGPNRYIGEVKGSGPASAVLGPFRVSFSGQGTLAASDPGVPGTVVKPYAEIYSGVWGDGELKEGKKSTDGKISSIGNANASIDIVSSKCILQVTSKRNANAVGPGALVSCARVEIGDFVRAAGPLSGFSISAVDGTLSAALHIKGQKAKPKTTVRPDSRTCMAEETFGLIEPPVPSDGDWKLTCSDQTASCRIEAATAGVVIDIKRRSEDVPEVTLSAVDNRNAEAQLIVDGETADVPGAAARDNGVSYYLIARLCNGEKAENKSLQRTVSLLQFCPLSAIAFARIYGCVSS